MSRCAFEYRRAHEARGFVASSRVVRRVSARRRFAASWPVGQGRDRRSRRSARPVTRARARPDVHAGRHHRRRRRSMSRSRRRPRSVRCASACRCAGVGWASRTLDKTGKPHDLELFKTVVGINLVGTFNVMRLAAAAMAKARAARSRRARRDHQHRIGRGVRRPDRPDRVRGVEGGRRRDDAARRRAISRPPGSASSRSRPASSTRRCSAHCPTTSARRSRRRRVSEAARRARGVRRSWSRRSSANGYLNGETIRLDGSLRMPPR